MFLRSGHNYNHEGGSPGIRNAPACDRLLRVRSRAKLRACNIVTVLFTIFLLTGWTGLAQPAVLHLRNGDRLTGHIVSQNTNHLVLTNVWTREITIPLSAILRRDMVAAATNAAAAPQPAAAAPKPAPQPPPPAKPKPSLTWAGDVQLGMDLGFGEKNRQLYTGRTKITMGYRRVRNLFDYNFAYGRTEGIISANRMDGSLKTDYDLTDRLYAYNLIGSGYDEIRLINFRYEVGPGLGYHLIKHTNFLLNAESGINYQAHYLADDTKTELFYHRFAEDFTWRINSRFTLDEKFEFFPLVGDWSVYRFRFESNLKYAIFNNLFLNFTVLDQYDSHPAQGVGHNDLQVRSTIGVKF